jgi:hypothetical protein
MAKKPTDLRERLTALLERADRLYDDVDDILPAFADKVRHSNIPAGSYVMQWRARGLGDCRVVLCEALKDVR